MPLFFIKGVMGKFIVEIPIPVVAALLVSLLEALFILPVHLRHLPASDSVPKMRISRVAGQIRGTFQNGLTFVLDRVYSPLIRHMLEWRYAVRRRHGRRQCDPVRVHAEG
jgi:multidrug efflux pump subunit AcrB